MARLLMPLPARDFDPSEAAVNWRVLRDAGHRVQFATPDGRSAAADDIMLTGQGLDLYFCENICADVAGPTRFRTKYFDSKLN